MANSLAQKTFPALAGQKFAAQIVSLTPSSHPNYMKVTWSTECNGQVVTSDFLLHYSDPFLLKDDLQCFVYEGEVMGHTKAATVLILALAMKQFKDQVEFTFTSSDGKALEDACMVWHKKRGTKTFVPA